MRTRFYSAGVNSRVSTKGVLLLILGILTLLAAVSSLKAQEGPAWSLGPSSILGETYSSAQARHPDHGWATEAVGDTVRAFSTGTVDGIDTAYARSLAGVYMATLPTSANAFVWFRVDGEGTSRLRIRWYGNSDVFSDNSASAALYGMVKYAVQLNLGTGGGSGDSVDVDYVWSQRVFVGGAHGSSHATFSHHGLRFEAVGRDSLYGLPTHRYVSLYDLYGDFPSTMYANSDSVRENETGSLRLGADDTLKLFTNAWLYASPAGVDMDAQVLVYGEMILSLDGPVAAGTLDEWIDDVPLDGANGDGNVAGLDDASTGSSGNGDLLSSTASPNPFSADAGIGFDMVRSGSVTAAIANERGEIVRVIDTGVLPAGRSVVRWDGTDMNGHVVPAGAYFYRISVAGENGSRTAGSGSIVFAGR